MKYSQTACLACLGGAAVVSALPRWFPAPTPTATGRLSKPYLTSSAVQAAALAAHPREVEDLYVRWMDAVDGGDIAARGIKEWFNENILHKKKQTATSTSGPATTTVTATVTAAPTPEASNVGDFNPRWLDAVDGDDIAARGIKEWFDEKILHKKKKTTTSSAPPSSTATVTVTAIPAADHTDSISSRSRGPGAASGLFDRLEIAARGEDLDGVRFHSRGLDAMLYELAARGYFDGGLD